MSRDKKDRTPPPPPATPVMPVAPEPVSKHDDHAADDFAKPYVQMFIAKVMKFFVDHRAVDRFMRDLGAAGKVGVQALPGAVALGVRKMPDSWFKNPEMAHFFRDIIRDAAKDLAEILKEKGEGALAEDVENAVKTAEKAAMDRMLVVDPVGHVHVTECARLSVFRKPGQQQSQNPRNPNQPQPPQQQPTSNLTELALKDVIAQGLHASPCCIKQVQEMTEKATAAPKSVKKNRSPLEILGSIKDDELRKQFRDWLNGLPSEDRTRAFHALHELDSEEEFNGLMSMDPLHRMEFLPLLENRNASHAVRKFLGVTGAFLKNGWNIAAEHYTAWNDSLLPEVSRLQKKFHDDQGNVTPYKKPTWAQSLKKILSLNPF